MKAEIRTETENKERARERKKDNCFTLLNKQSSNTCRRSLSFLLIWSGDWSCLKLFARVCIYNLALYRHRGNTLYLTLGPGQFSHGHHHTAKSHIIWTCILTVYLEHMYLSACFITLDWLQTFWRIHHHAGILSLDSMPLVIIGFPFRATACAHARIMFAALIQLEHCAQTAYNFCGPTEDCFGGCLYIFVHQYRFTAPGGNWTRKTIRQPEDGSWKKGTKEL